MSSTKPGGPCADRPDPNNMPSKSRKKGERGDPKTEAFSDMLEPEHPEENSHYSKIDLRPHHTNPYALFEDWIKEAQKSGLSPYQTSVFNLATCTKDGKFSMRMISLKELKNNMFIFTIDECCRGGQQLKENRSVCALFYLDFKRYRSQYQKVIRVEGKVRRLCSGVTQLYWEREPMSVQIKEAISTPGTPTDWNAMKKIHDKLVVRLKCGEKLDMPAAYHGFALIPDIVEFYQNEIGYMADRVVYSRGCDCGWNCVRLSP